jgi:peptide methionine sulfoxide reductase MsrB
MNSAITLQFDLTPPHQEQLRTLITGLSDEERHLLLDHGEEAPFCGVFLTEKQEGIYTCRLCGLPLFEGSTKFESVPGGRASRRPLPMATCAMSTTAATAWSGPRSCAAVAARTKVTSSPTDRHLRLSAIASTQARLSSRQKEAPCRTSSGAAHPKARHGKAELCFR